VAKDKEPITPFVDKVRQLYRDMRVSTVLVMGGSGDYFDVAGLVIMMEVYRPFFVTGRARQIAGEMPIRRQPEGGGAFRADQAKGPFKAGVQARTGPQNQGGRQGAAHHRFR